MSAAQDSGGINVDTDLYDTKEDAVEALLTEMGPGDTIIVCRDDWKTCPDGETCPMCARVVVQDGMTAADVLRIAKGHRA